MTQPLVWVLLLLLICLFLKNRKWQRKLLASAILVLFVAGNSVVSSTLMGWWELQATPIGEVPHYDVAIVLGGVTDGFREPRDRVYTHKGADRVLHAAYLYQLGLVKKILVTGTFMKVSGESASEASAMKKLLMLCQVPEGDIIIESGSRNTRENALFSAEILSNDPALQSVLLITSAFHMRRAKGCFEKAGLTVDTFTTDFYADTDTPSPISFIFPSESALSVSSKLIHEITGYLVYKLVGYA